MRAFLVLAVCLVGCGTQVAAPALPAVASIELTPMPTASTAASELPAQPAQRDSLRSTDPAVVSMVGALSTMQVAGIPSGWQVDILGAGGALAPASGRVVFVPNVQGAPTANQPNMHGTGQIVVGGGAIGSVMVLSGAGQRTTVYIGCFGGPSIGCQGSAERPTAMTSVLVNGQAGPGTAPFGGVTGFTARVTPLP